MDKMMAEFIRKTRHEKHLNDLQAQFDQTFQMTRLLDLTGQVQLSATPSEVEQLVDTLNQLRVP